jgi:hypothetical protein
VLSLEFTGCPECVTRFSEPSVTAGSPSCWHSPARHHVIMLQPTAAWMATHAKTACKQVVKSTEERGSSKANCSWHADNASTTQGKRTASVFTENTGGTLGFSPPCMQSCAWAHTQTTFQARCSIRNAVALPPSPRQHMHMHADVCRRPPASLKHNPHCQHTRLASVQRHPTLQTASDQQMRVVPAAASRRL